MPQVKSLQETCPKVLVLLGSNATSILEDSAKLVHEAVFHIADKKQRITKISRYYSTPCFPAGAGPDFVNVAVEVETERGPEELLQILHEIEDFFGRERPSRWAPRTLDLDLVAYGDLVLPDRSMLMHWMELPLEEQKKIAPDQLILPHPRMHERAFVLIPLADIAAEWAHPITGKSVREMVEALPLAEKMGVQPLPTP